MYGHLFLFIVFTNMFVINTENVFTITVYVMSETRLKCM